MQRISPGGKTENDAFIVFCFASWTNSWGMGFCSEEPTRSYADCAETQKPLKHQWFQWFGLKRLIASD